MPTEQLKYELTAQDKGVSKALGGIKTGLGALQQALPGAVAPLVEILEKSEQIGEHFETSGNKAQKALTGIGSVGLGVGLALQGLASQEQAATGNLRNAIENLGLSWEDYDKQVEATIKTGEHFGQTAASTQNTLATLTQATNDPALALKYYNTVLDLSVAKHEDAATAATQLAQAYNGSARILHQFGIDGLKGQAALDALSAKLKGDASTSADTFTGHIKAIGAALDDDLSKFGEKFGPAITAVSGGMIGLSAGISVVNKGLDFFRSRSAAATTATTEQAAAEASTTATRAAAVASLDAEIAAGDAAAAAAGAHAAALGAEGAASTGAAAEMDALIAALDAEIEAANAAALAAERAATALVAEGAAGVTAGAGVAEGAAVGAAGISGLKAVLVSTGIGAVLVGIGFAVEKAFGQKSTAIVGEFTQAIKDDGGAIAAHTAVVVRDNLAKGGALDLAQKYGISLDDVTQAALGNADAIGRVRAAVEKLPRHNAGDFLHLGSTKEWNDGQKLLGLIGDQAKGAADDLRHYNQTEQDSADTTDGLTLSLNSQQTAFNQQAGAAGEASVALGGVETAAELAHDKAQALTTQLDAMNAALKMTAGLNLDKKIAEGQLYAAGRSYAQSIAKNGKTLSPTTEAGLANLQAEQSVQQAYVAFAQSINSDKSMSHDARAKALQGARQELFKLTGSYNVASGAADKNKASIDKQIASLQEQKRRLGDNTSTVGMSAKAIESHRASVIRQTTAIDNHIGRLRAEKSATEHGTTAVHLSAAEVDNLAAVIGKVPTEWMTRVQLDDAAARLKGGQLKKFLEALDPTLRAQVQLDLTAARAQLQSLMGIVNVGVQSPGGVPFLPGKAPAYSKATTNNFTGPVTVHANDPKAMARALENQARMAELAGVHVAGH